MKYEMTHLKKGVFELDFVKNEDGNNYTCATSFARKCGFDENSVRRIIRENKILKDGTAKLQYRDTKNRPQRMTFIHSDLFLYFLSKIEGLKGAAVAPDFVQNLILLYPKFLKELTKRTQILLERMETNRTTQLRLDKITRLENFCRKEKSRLVNEMKKRNIEEVIFDYYPDGSVQPELELEDKFYRNIVEVEFEIITDND